MIGDFKLSEEVAREQIDKFLEYYDIDIDNLPEKHAEATEMSINRLVKAIRRGKLEIDDLDGLTLKQHIGDTSLVYGELTGRAKTAMGKKSDGDHYGKMYALCGSLTGVGEAGILKIKGADLSICECIGALFLQV